MDNPDVHEKGCRGVKLRRIDVHSNEDLHLWRLEIVPSRCVLCPRDQTATCHLQKVPTKLATIVFPPFPLQLPNGSCFTACSISLNTVHDHSRAYPILHIILRRTQLCRQSTFPLSMLEFGVLPFRFMCSSIALERMSVEN